MFQCYFNSIDLQEVLVDSKCQQYTAGVQDQIDELKAKVDRIEVNKSGQNMKNNEHSFAKGMKKRAIRKALRGNVALVAHFALRLVCLKITTMD